MNDPSIAFIGAGNMAAALIGGLIADGTPPDRLIAADPDTERLRQLAASAGIRTLEDNAEAVRAADVVVLAVKPQVLQQVASGLAEAIQAHRPLVISIAAGVRSDTLQRWLGGGVALVRSMPNTPAMLQAGATALYATPEVDAAQREQAETVLRAVGLVRWVEDESLMDAVTALSGSGPAYFFLFMEALEQAGERLGLPADTARLLTLQTALGAARMAIESGEDPAELRRRVTSPGGTTERAIASFEADDLAGVVQRALSAARDRSVELSQLLDEGND
ncbi:MAG TPA: pyrroline-5-carboxylate reductase [Gammaproteobacteria bacterium]|nr:pyrroline-5-carboxylate reductase [Gammaproteobacteria bacterium]